MLCLLFFSVNCHEHQPHLAKDNLKIMQTLCDTLCSEAEVETVLYFSSLATIINTWRFSLRAFFMKWTELRGPASSMLHASRQPQKCFTGRWGAVDDAARFLLRGLGQIWSWCSRKHGAPRKLLTNARGLLALSMLRASSTQPAPERESRVSFGDLPSSLADDGGCILQCQGAASSLPQVLDGSAQRHL